MPMKKRAFDDLAAWVHGGPKPDGDNIMGDLRDAGKKLTNPLRQGDPGHLNVKWDMLQFLPVPRYDAVHR
jgi:hypothetical protein